jgi:hypothetical protein
MFCSSDAATLCTEIVMAERDAPCNNNNKIMPHFLFETCQNMW